MSDRGLNDPGRAIDRDPRAIAQKVLSLVRAAGADGVDVLELQRAFPAHSSIEIEKATAILVADGSVRELAGAGAARLVEVDPA